MDGQHEVPFAQLWAKSDPDFRTYLISERPDVFFFPPYVAHRGWIGIRLDLDLDFNELADLLDDAYRLVAPPRLVQLLEGLESR